jgi:hypothetical protein
MKNRRLVLITFFSYCFIYICNEKFAIPMIIGLPISILGVYDIPTSLVPITGITGVAIVFYLLVKKSLRVLYHHKLLGLGVCLMIYPLFIFRSINSILIEYHQAAYLFIPEIIFYISICILTSRILLRTKWDTA